MENKEIIKDFLEGTPKWCKAMKKTKQKSCVVCGIIPDNMARLVKAIKELEEKAWRYDDLNK